MTHAILRPYRPEDRDALFDICIRTGHEGGDSRHFYEDPDLLPNIFAAPYVVLEPDLAFVVEDGGRAVGYILGTADTASFVARYRTEWLPGLADRYPAPVQPQSPSTPAEMMTGLLHDPERMVLPELDAYPAHLHIDLLPSHQQYGYGRALMETFPDALHARGVRAVHLSMLTANTPARAFYDRVGFHGIAVPDPGPVTYLGRSTATTPPR
ncbi:GNAT family N-acetyltransferase [Streptomyces cyaneofuscatus]|uniref:GNAT family N-acetyltransferase n=1 Tax=Streptomyces cyaneofuscatus TaxID=66883 RepID=UPI0038187AA9